jgi:hypothetical protein
MLRKLSWLALIILFSSTASAANHDPRTLYVLFIWDADAGRVGDDISGPARRNIEQLRDAFTQIVTKHNEDGEDKVVLKMFSMTGDQLTALDESVERFFNQLSFDGWGRDPIFVYYCGHGVTDNSRRHWLATSRNSFLRSSIRANLRYLHSDKYAPHNNWNNGPKYPPGRITFISDTCGSFASSPLPAPAPPSPGGDREVDWETFRSLIVGDSSFLGNADEFIDITAAKPGQYAWFDQNGGVFTRAFLQLLYSKHGDFVDEENPWNTWNRAFDKLTELTRDEFRRLKETVPDSDSKAEVLRAAKSQEPYAWNLGYCGRLVSFVNRTGEDKLTLQVQVYSEAATGRREWRQLDWKEGESALARDVTHLRWRAWTESGRTFGDFSVQKVFDQSETINPKPDVRRIQVKNEFRN